MAQTGGTLEADRQDRKTLATKIVAARDARDERRARREAVNHVLAAFRSVSARRYRPTRGADPTRSQRPSTRLHGATRHGQRRAAFEQRAALRVESTRRHLAAVTDPHRMTENDLIALNGLVERLDR